MTIQLRLDGTPEPTDLPEPTDPRIVECPSCRAKAGRYCKRPSGHKAMGYHVDRVKAAAREALLTSSPHCECGHQQFRHQQLGQSGCGDCACTDFRESDRDGR